MNLFGGKSLREGFDIEGPQSFFIPSPQRFRKGECIKFYFFLYITEHHLKLLYFFGMLLKKRYVGLAEISLKDDKDIVRGDAIFQFLFKGLFSLFVFKNLIEFHNRS